MTSSSSEYEEFSDSWSSSEPSFDRPRCKKQAKKDEPLPVEVLASGVAFLLPAQSPLICGLGVKRSKVVLPNVDPKTLARLILHLMNTKTPLDIQSSECASLLRLAMVFNMEDIFQKTRNHVLTVINGQGGQLAAFGRVVGYRLRSRSMVDDAFLVTLDRVLVSLQDVQHLDQGAVQQPLQGAGRPALTPLSQCPTRRLNFPSMPVQATHAVEGPKVNRKPKFNLFELLIRPKKMSKKRAAVAVTQKQPGAEPFSQNYKKPDSVKVFRGSTKSGASSGSQNSKEIAAVPLSQNSKKPALFPSSQYSKGPTAEVTTTISKSTKAPVNSGGGQQGKSQDNPTLVKKNPLALSVIRKIPRTKPH